MPQFFFTVTTDQEDQDAQGQFLHSERDAAEEALTIAGEVLKASDGPFWNAPAWRLVILDEAGDLVCKITMEGIRRTRQDADPQGPLSTANGS